MQACNDLLRRLFDYVDYGGKREEWRSWNYNVLATLLGEVQDSWHLQS